MSTPFSLDSMKPLAGRVLQEGLNRAIRLDPASREKLQALEGRRIEAHPQSPDIALAIDVREGQLTTTVIQLRYRNGRLVGEVTSSVMTPLAPPVVPPRTAAVQQASMSPGVKTFLGLGLLFGAIWVFDQTQPPNKRIIKFP